MAKYNAILVDPFTQTTKEITVTSDYKQWKEILEITSPIDMVTLNSETAVIVDDEGLFNEDTRYFKLPDYPQPLAGRAIVVGIDEDGEITDYNSGVSDSSYLKIKWMPEGFSVSPQSTFIPFDNIEDMFALLERSK
jgi:hypothetical protein